MFDPKLAGVNGDGTSLFQSSVPFGTLLLFESSCMALLWLTYCCRRCSHWPRAVPFVGSSHLIAALPCVLLHLMAAGVHKMVYNSVMMCDAYLRPFLFNNIVIAGGTSMLPGRCCFLPAVGRRPTSDSSCALICP